MMSSRGYPGYVDKDVQYWMDLYPIWDPVMARNVGAYLEDALVSAERSYTFIILVCTIALHPFPFPSFVFSNMPLVSAFRQSN